MCNFMGWSMGEAPRVVRRTANAHLNHVSQAANVKTRKFGANDADHYYVQLGRLRFMEWT